MSIDVCDGVAHRRQARGVRLTAHPPPESGSITCSVLCWAVRRGCADVLCPPFRVVAVPTIRFSAPAAALPSGVRCRFARARFLELYRGMCSGAVAVLSSRGCRCLALALVRALGAPAVMEPRAPFLARAPARVCHAWGVWTGTASEASQEPPTPVYRGQRPRATPRGREPAVIVEFPGFSVKCVECLSPPVMLRHCLRGLP